MFALNLSFKFAKYGRPFLFDDQRNDAEHRAGLRYAIDGLGGRRRRVVFWRPISDKVPDRTRTG
jgi:hypothetical protein